MSVGDPSGVTSPLLPLIVGSALQTTFTRCSAIGLFWTCCAIPPSEMCTHRTYVAPCSQPGQSPDRPTPKRVGWTATGPSLSGRLHEPGQVPHCPETKASPSGYLRHTGSLGIRSGRHAHAPGSSSSVSCLLLQREPRVQLTHDMYLNTWKCGSLSFVFAHLPEG